MRNTEWIFIYNHIDGKKMGDRSKLSEDKQEELKRFTIPFRLYDDDGVLYFTGLMSEDLYNSEEIFDPLDYSMNLWGCTEMKVKGEIEGGEYTTL